MGTLGANCTCTKGLSHDQIYNDFFNGMRIKCKPSKDISELIKVKLSGLKEITDKRWLIIIENILLNDEQKEESLSFWQKALEDSREFFSENMLYLVLLLLTEENLTDFKLFFKDLMLTACGYKAEISIDSIQKAFLIKIINLYIYIISKLPIHLLSHLSSNPTEFESIGEKAFDSKIQIKYIEDILMKDEYKDEWVNYDKFFDDKYKILFNHAEIRNSMIKIAYENSDTK